MIEQDQVYLEHTLLPFQMATQTVAGIVTLMPRWLDYQRQRAPTFGRYLLLERRVMSDTLMDYDKSATLSLPILRRHE